MSYGAAPALQTAVFQRLSGWPALAGVAISMTVASLVQMVILANANAFNEFRFWAAGSVEGRGYPVLLATGGFIAVGLDRKSVV